jgi:GH25 family lysozyme M1 (1,4-beta-N-acetylmuramidase)
MLKGIDIYHKNKIENWDKIKDSGIDFIIHKCTQGSEFVDHLFKERQKEARKRNLFIGSYHFAGKGFLDAKGKLYFVAQDPIVEADLYIKNADPKEGELLILDWEIEYKDPVKWCSTFIQHVFEKTRIKPFLYTNDARAIKYPWPSNWKFWIARYPKNDNGTMQTEPSFKNWSLWQFSSKGKVDGIAGNVDLNYTPLSLPELTGNTSPSPIPSPTGPIKYSQNNPLWKDDFMGSSNLTLGKFGCTTSAICTLASYFGETLTPKDLAKHKELYNSEGKMLWKQLDHILEKLNFLYRYYSFSETVIDDALIKDPNKCVILNVDRGYHWVSALKKTNLGYTCSDPYPFPAKNRNYKNWEISGFTIFVKK